MLSALVFASLASASAIPRALVERSNLTASANGWVIPAGRAWVDAFDSYAPCGNAPLGNRESFPLSAGPISLLNRRDGDNVEFKVSFSENPSSDGDFKTFLPTATLLTRGHHCFAAPDFAALGGALNGVATLQISYTAGADNARLYQCADVTFVDGATYTLPHGKMCFDGAEEGETPDLESYGDKKPMSSGIKAAIGVSSAVGALLLLGAAFFGYKRHQNGQTKKAIARAEQDNKTIAGDSMAERKF